MPQVYLLKPLPNLLNVPPKFNYLVPSRRSLANLQLVRASTDTYARKYEYITYQVFMSNIPTLFMRNIFFYLFKINKPSADIYAYKYGYITYQVFILNISSISKKTGHINYLLFSLSSATHVYTIFKVIFFLSLNFLRSVRNFANRKSRMSSTQFYLSNEIHD